MYHLTMLEIDRLTEEMREACGDPGSNYAGFYFGKKIDAIKSVRRGLDLGLRDAKEYVDAYWPDRLVVKFREDMLRMSGLSDQVVTQVYQNISFKLEMKDPVATYEDLRKFIDIAWGEMHEPKE